MLRGERIPPASALSNFLGVDTAAGELTFSVRRGFVVEMLPGVGFLDAAIFAASAPNCRIARFCSEEGNGVLSFGVSVLAVDMLADAAWVGAGFAGAVVAAGVGAAVTPRASLSSSYSFHSSICSRS